MGEFDDLEEASDDDLAVAFGDLPEATEMEQVVAKAKPLRRDDTARDFGKGVEQGATLGFSDEVAGLGAALGAGLGRFESPQAMDAAMRDAYREGRDEERAEVAQATERSPWATGAGRVGGGLMLTPFAPAGWVQGGATMGAGYGLGGSEAETLGGMAADTGTGAALGAAFGLAGKGTTAALGAAGQRMAQGSTGGMVPAAREVARQTAEMPWFEAAKSGIPAMVMKAGARPVAASLNAAERASMAAGRQLAKLAPPQQPPPLGIDDFRLAPSAPLRTVPQPAVPPPPVGSPGNPAVQNIPTSMPAGSLPPRAPTLSARQSIPAAMPAGSLPQNPRIPQGGPRAAPGPVSTTAGQPPQAPPRVIPDVPETPAWQMGGAARPGGWDPRLGMEPPPAPWMGDVPPPAQSMLGGLPPARPLPPPPARLQPLTEQRFFQDLNASLRKPLAPVPRSIPAGTLTDIEQRVIQAVATNPGATLAQLARRIGIPENQVRAALQPLMFRGHVAGQGGTYSVTGN